MCIEYSDFAHFTFQNTVTSAVTRVSLSRIGCNTTYELVSAVCITPNSAYASWL